MATVKEIQVCGGNIYHNLSDACVDYLKCVDCGMDREKIVFSITLTNGEVKHITFRQEDERVVVYGNFDGLPTFLEYAQGKESHITSTICPECLQERPDDERVKNGMKCGVCAGYTF